MDEASFLKKLSRQNEINQTGPPPPPPHQMVMVLNQKQSAGATQYASRYGAPAAPPQLTSVVNSPKYKENTPQGTSGVPPNPTAGSLNQPPKHHGHHGHHHHKRTSNSLQ
jgi:hypothetical protein